MSATARHWAAAAAVVVLLTAGCSSSEDGGKTGGRPDVAQSSGSVDPDLRDLSDKAQEQAEKLRESESSAPGATSGPKADHVLAISVDGVAVRVLKALGPQGAPTIHRMLEEGAGTLNARTALEMNVTLPNHVSMVTGRRIDRAANGHGVVWNANQPDDTVQASSGDAAIESMFSIADRAGRSTAFFSGKQKLDVITDSWPDAFDHVNVRNRADHPQQFAAEVSRQLADERPQLTFWHIPTPDAAGHRFGGASTEYEDALRATDAAIGAVLETIETTPDLRSRTLVILTSDHGFTDGTGHSAQKPANYTIPFVLWGADVPQGNLYAVAADLADPDRRHPGYDGPQPVRNLDMAAVALEALGLDPMTGDGVEGGAFDWR